MEDAKIVSDENEHIIKMWEPLTFNIDKDYKYVPNSLIFKLFSNFIYYFIAFPILKIYTKLLYNLKIEGKENIKNLDSGAISISNHVLLLDCALVGLCYGIKKVYYTTLEGSFKIPFVRRLIKFLRAVPIPKDITNKKRFLAEINNLLNNKKIVHFYPEASLWPYHKKIRKFRNGPFNIAIKNNVPIIPIVIHFREPNKIRKIFKRKDDITLKILSPIYYKYDESLTFKENISKLKQITFDAMNEANK